jgi:hypothetical protein
MTTLSTLIGSGHSHFGLGEVAAPPRATIWQRVGGAFRRRRSDAASAASANEAATNYSAPAEALKELVDGPPPEQFAIAAQEAADSLDEVPQFEFGEPLLPPTPPRKRLLWGAKRETAIDEVRAGMTALSSLLQGIQTNMERQGERQDEMADRQREIIACLSHLPMASAVQNESLQSIRDQIAQGTENTGRLCSALERLGSLHENTGEALTSISRRIDLMDARDANFTQSMEKVCDAMQTVSRASETGAIVLERVQNTLVTQQDGMSATLDKHQTKFNALMAVAIAVSAAALAVVAGVGYLVLTRI